MARAKGKKPFKIEHPYFILCEGLDDFNFLVAYLNSDALSSDPRFSSIIQIEEYDGVDNLAKFLANLIKMDNFEKIYRILIIRDAETEASIAPAKIQSALFRNNLPVPPSCNKWIDSGGLLKIAFTLFPSCSDVPVNGALEDLCWQILERQESEIFKSDVQSFVDHMKDKYNSVGAHEHKSRLHTYFSVNDNFISKKIGEASQAGAFNWNHEKLEPLKSLIEAGF